VRHLDANVLIRYITQDVEWMADRAEELLARIDSGEEAVALLDANVAEVVYVLGSSKLYRLSREAVVEALMPILQLDGIRVENKARCLLALQLYARYRSVNFADALMAAAALEDTNPEVYTFDRKVRTVPGLTSIQP
jgi:predicted nucleic acid-binding protein